MSSRQVQWTVWENKTRVFIIRIPDWGCKSQTIESYHLTYLCIWFQIITLTLTQKSLHVNQQRLGKFDQFLHLIAYTLVFEWLQMQKLGTMTAAIFKARLFPPLLIFQNSLRRKPRRKSNLCPASCLLDIPPLVSECLNYLCHYLPSLLSVLVWASDRNRRDCFCKITSIFLGT